MPPLIPAAKLRPVAAEHDDAAAGHVLAAVVADALDDGVRAGVAHGEALARQAAEERPAGGGAVQHGVADDHVLLGAESAPSRAGAPTTIAARQALAGVVVGLAAQRERHARAPARRRSSGRPSPMNATSIVPSGRPSAPWRRAISPREEAADGAVDVADRHRSELRPASPRSIAGRAPARSAPSRARRRAPAPGGRARRRGAPAGSSGIARTLERSTPRAFQWSIAASMSQQVGAADQVVEACARPSAAMSSRASSATKTGS